MRCCRCVGLPERSAPPARRPGAPVRKLRAQGFAAPRVFLSLDSPRGSITGEAVARGGGCAGSAEFGGLAALGDGDGTGSCHDGPQPGADGVVDSGQEGGDFETRPGAVRRNVRELIDGRTIGRRRGEVRMGVEGVEDEPRGRWSLSGWRGRAAGGGRPAQARRPSDPGRLGAPLSALAAPTCRPLARSDHRAAEAQWSLPANRGLGS